MRCKTSLLMLVALIVAGLAIVGCGPAPAQFVLSNLQIPLGTVEVSEEVAISVDVANTGGVEGSYTANLTVNGAIVDTEDVTLAAGATQEVTFTYTPTTEGEYTIAVGGLSGTLVVVAPVEGWWRIPYQVVGGTFTLNVSVPSLASIKEITVDFPVSTFDMLINKTVVNGSREFVIDAPTFVVPLIPFPGVITGVDLDLGLSLEDDATGTGYTAGIGDVDVSSESRTDVAPQTSFILGDGTPDPAGSAIVEMPFLIEETLNIGTTSTYPLTVVMTTGHSYNIITRPGKPFDDSETEGDGVLLTEDGGPAPYVGTSGTLVTTGAVLARQITGMEVDFQFKIVVDIEAVPGWEQE